MKQLINPLPAGRMPVFKDDLLILQDENYIATKSICQGIGSPMIVSGCIATNLGGGNVQITSGVLFLDSEFIKFGGYTGSYPVYLEQGTPVTTTKTYFDASTQTVYSELTVNATTVLPSGEFITFNFDNTADRLLTKINAVPIALISGLYNSSKILKHLQSIGSFSLNTSPQTILSFVPFATKSSASMRYTIYLEYTPPNDDAAQGQSIILILKKNGATIKQFESTVSRNGYRQIVSVIWNDSYAANQSITLEGLLSNNNATIHFGQLVMEAFDGI